MTWLERRVPELWSLKTVVRNEPTSTVGNNVSQIRILTVADSDFLELQKEPEYHHLPDGGLAMTDGNLKILVYSMAHNDRLLKE
jgi:hypothetical protein